MKKVIVGIILIIILSLALNTVVLAENATNTLKDQNANEILTVKKEVNSKLDEYTEKYDSEAYGLAAYILNRVRIYSIPFGFVSIIIAAIYQYIIGLKKLDVRDKGFALMIASVTIVVICQVLPLVFAIVVKGWRG